MTVRYFLEPFAGSAAVSLSLCGGPGELLGYMGRKRLLAGDILGALDLRAGQGAERVILCDAGPWAEAWQVMADRPRRRQLCQRLYSWEGRCPVGLWRDLVAQPPPADAVERVAQWMWLQARSASSCPVWWDPVLGWRMGDKPRVGGASAVRQKAASQTRAAAAAREPCQKATGDQGIQQAHAQSLRQKALQDAARQRGQNGRPRPADQRGRDGGRPREAGQNKRVGGIQHPATLARRLEALGDVLNHWTILSGDTTTAPWPEDLEDAVAYLDPPYVGCTGYPADCPREAVLALARGLEARGARVAISEAVPLPLAGWHYLEITRPGGKAEWLTLSHPPARVRQLGEQLQLLEVA